MCTRSCAERRSSVEKKRHCTRRVKKSRGAIRCFGHVNNDAAVRDAVRAMLHSDQKTAAITVVDDFLEKSLASACASLCRDSLAPLTVSLGQRDIGRDDSLFIFALPDAGKSDADDDATLRHPTYGSMTADRLVPLIRVSRQLLSLSNVLTEEFGYAISAPRQLQLARYGGSAESIGYARHLDNTIDHGDTTALAGPSGQRICDRAVTAIVYLDGSCDGGEFCVYSQHTNSTEEEACRIVDPRAGRLVLFPSRVVEHAVLPVTSGERWALSAWFTHIYEQHDPPHL